MSTSVCNNKCIVVLDQVNSCNNNFIFIIAFTASHFQTTQKIAPKPHLIRKTNKVKKQKKVVVANFEVRTFIMYLSK